MLRRYISIISLRVLRRYISIMSLRVLRRYISIISLSLITFLILVIYLYYSAFNFGGKVPGKKVFIKNYYFRWYKTHGNNIRVIEEEIRNYSPFNITEPHFISEEARYLFYLDNTNKESLGVPSVDKLTGKTYIIRNGTYGPRDEYDCGYKSDISYVLKERVIKPRYWYHTLIPILVPAGSSFQHFMDGTLPKLIQALEYIRQPNVKLLMRSSKNNVVNNILRRLNVSENIVPAYRKDVGADNLIFVCNTPPIHPYLWLKARALIGVEETLQLPKRRANIVIVTRDGCKNCGRNILNIEALKKALKSKYINNHVLTFRRPYHLRRTINIFGKTAIVIGVHGGGMYNINFCPKDITVIEIMPTHSDGSVIAAADKIIWFQSVMLEHHYWRMPADPANEDGDVIVNITQVEYIVDTVLARVDG